MNLHSPFATVLVGAVVGVCVGLVGTSGALMIPVMVLVFGLSQLQAQGTALFIALLPIWFMPLLPYARAGHVQWKLGLLLAAGVALGGFVGGTLAQHLPQVAVRRCFAVALFGLALRMFLQR